jgi:membrane associated rhomboid family serine protease
MVHSGSRLYLFIGINIIIFLILNLTRLIEFLFTKETPWADWLTIQLSMPAYLPNLVYKFWTPLTYMFTQRDFFHILFNMLWLYWMGRIFEDFLNKQQFTFTYLAGGFAGAFLYILSYYTFPVFEDQLQSALILGASASVSAIVIATATLVPDYTVSLLFFGVVRLKYLALVFLLIDLITIVGPNPGGSIAHLGGALLGFIYIKQLRSGRDWSRIFKRRSKLKVVKTFRTGSFESPAKGPDQETIDRILDKISQSGYNSLTKKEKEQLFKASNKK